MSLTTPEILGLLRSHGFCVTDVIGSGMEGVVVGLADATVVKVWSSRSLEELCGFLAGVDDPGDRRPRAVVGAPDQQHLVTATNHRCHPR